MALGDNMKKKHTIISNIYYAISNIWKWDKAFYLFFVPSIPLAVFLPLMETYFFKVLIEAIEMRRCNKTVVLIIVIYFSVLLLVNLFNNFCQSRLQMRQYNLSCLYQNALSEKYMRTDYANTDNPKINIKYQNAMNDACSGQCSPEFIMYSLMRLLISLLGIFTYGTVIITISPLILAILLLSAYITYLISRWQRNYIEKNKDNWIALDRKIGYLQSLSEKFDYSKDIRIFGMFDWLTEMLSSFQNDRFIWVKKVSARSFGGSVISALLMLIQNGIAYTVLIIMILRSNMGVGGFIFYFGIITKFSAWLTGIANNFNDVVHKSIKIGYYREYFEIKEEHHHGNGCPLPKKTELPVDIEFLDVSYRYPSEDGEKNVLKNINLKIQKGEKLAIVGPNGAGKTTLVKLICGLYYPSSGNIKLNGHSVTQYNIEDYYSLFSAVFQDIYLLPVSIAEFVSSSENIIDRKRVMTVIEQAGLAKKINSLPNGIDSHLMKGIFDDSIEMSGGEKQKLMLARALYKDAPVIVLDEPTAALDPIAENELYLKYNELTTNKTAIYISHRLSSTRFCDRIIYLENGEIIEMGTHDELMKLGGKYAYMFELQSRYYRRNSK